MNAQQRGTLASSEAAAWFGGFCFLFQRLGFFFFFPAGLGGWLGGGTCVQHLLEVFPQVFSSLENRGFGTLFYFLFYTGRDVCGFFYPRLRLFPPVWLPEAVINAHLCSVALLTEFI